MQKIKNWFNAFFQMEASGGIILFFSAALALFFSNSALAPLYEEFIKVPINISIGNLQLNKNLLLLVNDGLMAIFFFLVGLEIKYELLDGDLSDPKQASFSVFAALGGMAIPALFFLSLTYGTPYSHAWGIPMATDIAFALGALALFGSRVPVALKVFLLALAIVDDLGAILVIAFFYTSEVATGYLGAAFLSLFLLYLLKRAGMKNIVWGITLGVFTWFCFLKSGVHATIAGVLLAFLAPRASLKELIHSIHPWSAFFIMPVFAFFNAGVSVDTELFSQLFQNELALGIIAGLVLGKPLGAVSFSWLAVRFKLAQMPAGTHWHQIIGVGFLAGIGFTMSLFISSLSFSDAESSGMAKLAILVASMLAALGGVVTLLIGNQNTIKS